MNRYSLAVVTVLLVSCGSSDGEGSRPTSGDTGTDGGGAPGVGSSYCAKNPGGWICSDFDEGSEVKVDWGVPNETFGMNDDGTASLSIDPSDSVSAPASLLATVKGGGSGATLGLENVKLVLPQNTRVSFDMKLLNLNAPSGAGIVGYTYGNAAVFGLWPHPNELVYALRISTVINPAGELVAFSANYCSGKGDEDGRDTHRPRMSAASSLRVSSGTAEARP